MVLAQQLADDCQLVESDRKLNFRIFHRIPLLSVGQLLASQRRSVFDGCAHLRVSVGKTTVVAVLAVACLLPVFAHDRLIVGSHFRVVKHSRKHLSEFGSRDYRGVRRERLEGQKYMQI